MNQSASILVIGDVHLGTACSGVPEGIASRGVDPEELTPAAALRLSVDLAIENRIDAVLFAGDVVESTNARFEAMGPLEDSVRRLLGAGIEVIAVAGNHDVEALPRLAALIDGFTLLGAGGQWEARTISKDRSPVVQVVGWSFGEARVRQSPVAELLKQAASGAVASGSQDRSAARGSGRVRRTLRAHQADRARRYRLRRLASGPYPQAITRGAIGVGGDPALRLSGFTRWARRVGNGPSWPLAAGRVP